MPSSRRIGFNPERISLFLDLENPSLRGAGKRSYSDSLSSGSSDSREALLSDRMAMDFLVFG
jgi:hypothetical protein